MTTRAYFTKRALTFSAACILVAIAPAAAWSCPSCQAALAASDGSQGDLVSGIFWSILFMMSMPFLIAGTFGGSMYLAVRRARAATSQTQAAPASETRRDLVEL